MANAPGCPHLGRLGPFEVSLLQSKFALVHTRRRKRRKPCDLPHFGSPQDQEAAARARECVTCGLAHLARGDSLLACLHCDFVGCWSPRWHLKEDDDDRRGCAGRHIQLHFAVSSEHWLGVDVEHPGRLYCARCADFVFDARFEEQERPRFKTPAACQAAPLFAEDDDDDEEEEQDVVVVPTKKGKAPLAVVEEDIVGDLSSGGWLQRCRLAAVPSLTPIAGDNPDADEAMSSHGLRGLQNLGNTCFMSCILQVFAHNPAFQAFFLYGGHARVACADRAAALLSAADHEAAVIMPSEATAARPVSPPPTNGQPEVDPCLACELCEIVTSMFAGAALSPGVTNGHASPLSAYDDAGSSNPASSNPVIVPHRMLYATWRFADNLAGYEQHDAHEFLMTLLHALATHLGGVTPNNGTNGSKDKTPLEAVKHFATTNGSVLKGFVHEVFCGQLLSDVVCCDCGSTSSISEPFLDLSLALSEEEAVANGQEKGVAPLRLEDCLYRFTCTETLTGKAHCAGCGEMVERRKQLTIERLPNVLIVHLKRFDGLKGKKIRSKVDYPVTTCLDLGPFLAPWRRSRNNGTTTTPPPHLYGLAAVVNHSGDLGQGHYTCYIKEGGEWYLCDDSQVRAVDAADVAESEGYILFYTRSDL